MVDKNFCIITIVDSISTTSMPVNEFVLFRHKNNYGFREIIISCSDEIPDNMEMPSGVEVYLVGQCKKEMRRILRQVKQQCEEHGEQLIVHLHAQRSAILFFVASTGLGLRKKTLFTIHSTYSSRNIKYKLSSCVCALLARYANCVSNTAYTEYSTIVKSQKRHRMQAILNGVDYQRIRKATQTLPPHTIVADMQKMVCIGRMIPIKNQQFLIRLLKDLPNTQLLLIGQEDDTIRQLACKEGVMERVEMTGLLPRDEVFRRLNECGLYVSASLVEGMPISVLEAMCVGLVPILSDIAPHIEIAKSEQLFNALPLVAKDWISTIKSYQQMDISEQRQLSQLIIENVRKKFSLETMHRKYIMVYEQLTK